MSLFNISPDKEKLLRGRMKQLKVCESDIEETFIRSSGPGGQNVNKVSTCVFLYHSCTGTTIKCQKTRSQVLNRYYARCLLLDEIEKRQREFEKKKRQAIAKKKRQNKKRSRRTKEKILEDKRYRSEKKSLRRKVKIKEID